MATENVAASAPGCRSRASEFARASSSSGACSRLAALISILTTVGIIVALLEPAIEFFREVSIVDYLTGKEWAPLFEPAQFGVLPLIVGHALRHDLGLRGRAAVRPRRRDLRQRVRRVSESRRILKPALEVLAAVPTIVYGFFGLFFVTPLLQDMGLGVEFFNALAAGLVIGVMVIPTVASLSEDAMTSVPQDLRDGAYASARASCQVSTRVVVPAAISGIVASFVLGISRAAGRDDDRAARRRHAAQPLLRPARAGRNHGGVHRRDRTGRRPDGIGRV